MRERFDQSPAIDAASNLRLVTMIQNHDEPYTEREDEILRIGVSQISKLAALKRKELKMPSRTTEAKIAYENGNTHAFGWAATTVRASPEQVLAYIWDVHKRSGRYVARATRKGCAAASASSPWRSHFPN
jgi:hypothetical protein